jgi:hypothetical protein
MATTYADLKTDIQTWMQNTGTDFTNQLDTFINNTEQRLLREIDPEAFVFNKFTNLTSGNRFLANPSDLLIIKNLLIENGSDRIFLEMKTDEFIYEYWPDDSQTGVPKYFANYDDDSTLLAPTPDSNYRVEMQYVGRIETLSTTNTTNWLTENADDALLYGCLSEASIFTKNMEDYALYDKRYQEIVAGLNNQSRRRRRTDYKFPASPAGTDTLTGSQ